MWWEKKRTKQNKTHIAGVYFYLIINIITEHCNTDHNWFHVDLSESNKPKYVIHTYIHIYLNTYITFVVFFTPQVKNKAVG